MATDQQTLRLLLPNSRSYRGQYYSCRLVAEIGQGETPPVRLPLLSLQLRVFEVVGAASPSRPHSQFAAHHTAARVRHTESEFRRSGQTQPVPIVASQLGLDCSLIFVLHCDQLGKLTRHPQVSKRPILSYPFRLFLQGVWPSLPCEAGGHFPAVFDYAFFVGSADCLILGLSQYGDLHFGHIVGLRPVLGTQVCPQRSQRSPAIIVSGIISPPSPVVVLCQQEVLGDTNG